MIIILLIISILILLWQVSNFVSVFFGAPYVKSDKKIIAKTLRLAELQKREVFYDLGSGNGEVLKKAAKTGAKIFGYEISPFYYMLSKFNTWNCPNIKIQYKNITKVDLSRADVVYCYLLPELLEKLKKKFQKEMKPGSRLISIGFPVNFKNVQVNENKFENRKIYIYKF